MTDDPTIRESSSQAEEIRDLTATVEALEAEISRLRNALRISSDALAGMVESHTDMCRDPRNEVCCACVMAIIALEDRSKSGARSVLSASPRTAATASSEATPDPLAAKLRAEVGEPSDGHDLADEVLGLLRVARQQRDEAWAEVERLRAVPASPETPRG